MPSMPQEAPFLFRQRSTGLALQSVHRIVRTKPRPTRLSNGTVAHREEFARRAAVCRELCRPQQDQPDRVEDDVEIFQLVDQRNSTVFQWLVHRRVPGGAGEEYDSVSQMGRSRHQRVVEVEAVELRHDEVAHHRSDRRIVRERLEGDATRIGFHHGETPALENLAQCAADFALIVYQENGRHERL